MSETTEYGTSPQNEPATDPLEGLGSEISRFDGLAGDADVSAPESAESTEPEVEGSSVELIARLEAEGTIQRELLNPLIRDRLAPLIDKDSPGYHPETYNHIVEMANIYLTQAALHEGPIELTVEDRDQLAQAALLHDVGKLDPEIMPLVRMDRILTEDETAIVAQHPEKSVAMIAENFRDKPLVLALILFHHQNKEHPTYDQETYERILGEMGITGESRQKFELLHDTFEAADQFEANTGERGYRPEPLEPHQVAQNVYNNFVKSGHGTAAVDQILQVQYPDRAFECEVVGTDKGPVARVTETMLKPA